MLWQQAATEDVSREWKRHVAYLPGVFNPPSTVGYLLIFSFLETIFTA